MRAPLVCLALAALLAACARSDGGAPTVYRGTDPAARRPVESAPASAPETQVAALPPGAGAAGVVDYGGYSAIVARPGDTVASMASRVGLSAAALSNYNGLPAGWTPRPGDELILPPRPEGFSGPIESAAIDPPEAVAAPAPEPTVETQDAAPPSASFDLAEIGAGLGAEPRDARAAESPGAPAEATPPPAPASEPSEPEAVFVPAPDPAPEPEPVAPEPVEPEPAVTEPAPAQEETRTAARTEPAPSAAAPAFIRPVDGSLARRYGEGPGGDGVDFAAPAGAQVVAAADGQVALVSESLGGYGTIVLIRHRDQLLTLYGRIDDVRVAKGDRVSQGDLIGAVAPAEGRETSLHFEVRRGVDSVDPARFLPAG